MFFYTGNWFDLSHFVFVTTTHSFASWRSDSEHSQSALCRPQNWCSLCLTWLEASCLRPMAQKQCHASQCEVSSLGYKEYWVNTYIVWLSGSVNRQWNPSRTAVLATLQVDLSSACLPKHSFRLWLSTTAEDENESICTDLFTLHPLSPFPISLHLLPGNHK